ncbi:MAG: enoyl-CoA hydratase [Microthrixaceae bacterium]
MSYITVEKIGRVAVITLNDPDRRNALNIDLNDELVSNLESLEGDPDTSALVITGAGKAFCAGADLSQLGASKRDGLLKIYEGFLSVARSPLPTVAAVNGAAVGAGMNLALACDLRIAGASARFDTRFLDLGIHPGGGHTWMFRSIAGQQATMAAVLFGQVLDASEAERVGLVWKSVPDDRLLETAVACATSAANAPSELVRRTKRTIQDMASVETHEAAVQRELGDQVWSMDQPAFAQSLAALQKKISGESK